MRIHLVPHRRSRHANPVRWLPLALLSAAALLLIACQTTISDEDIVTLEHDEFRALHEVRETERIVVVDVRSSRAYQEGHIPGAIHIPLPELDHRDPRLADAERIIVYGENWQSPRSPAAAKKLLAQGRAGVYEFRGGLERWQREGGEIAQPPTNDQGT